MSIADDAPTVRGRTFVRAAAVRGPARRAFPLNGKRTRTAFAALRAVTPSYSS